MSTKTAIARRSKDTTDQLLMNCFVWQGEPEKDRRYKEKKPEAMMQKVKTIYERTGRPRFRPPRSYR